MQDSPTVHPDKHFDYLDSARGIAALMVCYMHFFEAKYWGKDFLWYLWFIINGKDAVTFFFVLSGFVLSYKYIVLHKPLDIKRFYVSRFFRLYPPFLVILLINVLFMCRADLNWIGLKNIFLLDKSAFWEEAVLIRVHNVFYYPGWTLTLELIISFLMPFFITLAIKDKRFVPYMIVAFLLQGSNFYFYFLLGILLCVVYNKITDPSFRRSMIFRLRYPILLVAFVLFSMRNINALWPFGDRYYYWANFIGWDIFNYTGIGAFIFLGAILISKRIQRVLQNRVLVFFGKISFGLYLVHPLAVAIINAFIPPVVAAANRGPKFYLGVNIVPYTLMIFTFATIMHYGVERPFMNWGKRVAKKVKPSIIVQG